MKRAKLVLGAIAVLAVAGGSLAFKAANFSPLTLYTTDQPGDIATAPYLHAVITNTDAGGAQLFYYTDNSGDHANSQTFITENDD